MDLKDRKLFAIAADLVVFAFDGGDLKLLLVRRAKAPFKGEWVLPGGFLEDGEDLDACAIRELKEETGLELRKLSQIAVFSAPGRDPRGDVISVPYIALVRLAGVSPIAGSDADDAEWIGVNSLPPLAFDHAEIVEAARKKLLDGLYQTTDVFELLPPSFTLSEAQTVFECVSGGEIDKRNFRSWALKKAPLIETGEQRTGAHRPARTYSLPSEPGASNE